MYHHSCTHTIRFLHRITYNCTLSAHARDSSSQEPWDNAIQLLDRIESMDEERKVNPDQVTYTIALGAWLSARNISLKDALQAKDLVQRSLELSTKRGWNCKPDIHVLATLMQVCGKVTGDAIEQEAALKIVLETMDDCLSGTYGQINHVAYASGMKAINRLSNDESKQQEMLQTMFEKCAAGGHVSQQVVISMKIGLWKETAPLIRKEWSRRVPFPSKPKL